jgi:hypothetical protein
MVDIYRQKKYGFEKFKIAYLLNKYVLLQHLLQCKDKAAQINLAGRGDLELSYCSEAV